MTASLSWLARHQDSDGSWRVTGHTDACRDACEPNPGAADFDTGVTGLALLAFLGAGYTHLSRDLIDGCSMGDVVRKAVQWLAGHQDAEGAVGRRSAAKFLYGHAIAALALSEAYGMTGSPLLREPAERAIRFLVAAQNPGRGWRYEPRSGENDTSATGWAIMALKSAELSGLPFPASGYDGARAWLDEVTDPESVRSGYTARGTGKVFIPGVNEDFRHHETATALALMGRIFMDRRKSDPRHAKACAILLQDLPRWAPGEIDFYYWYSASLALFQADGPKGPRWKEWDASLVKAILPNQHPQKTGCRRGSWEPVDRWSAEGGRVYATAINTLTLEVYYRYASAFGRVE